MLLFLKNFEPNNVPVNCSSTVESNTLYLCPDPETQVGSGSKQLHNQFREEKNYKYLFFIFYSLKKSFFKLPGIQK